MTGAVRSLVEAFSACLGALSPAAGSCPSGGCGWFRTRALLDGSDAETEERGVRYCCVARRVVEVRGVGPQPSRGSVKGGAEGAGKWGVWTSSAVESR